MSGTYPASLLGVLLVCLSCTAGHYDVTPCDPAVKNLSLDVCKQLNSNATECMLYQCDRATSSCKLSARDYDRDGDPDIACMGTDCNDYDPAFNGANKTCSCQASKIGTECVVGVGACLVKAMYQCRNLSLYCAEALPAKVDYMDHIEPVSKSSDWNCDGVTDIKCRATPTSELGTCPKNNCTDPMPSGATIKAQIESGNYDLACKAYCESLNNLDANCTQGLAHEFICDNTTCGKPIVTCYCAPGALLACAKAASPATIVRKVLCN